MLCILTTATQIPPRRNPDSTPPPLLFLPRFAARPRCTTAEAAAAALLAASKGKAPADPQRKSRGQPPRRGRQANQGVQIGSPPRDAPRGSSPQPHDSLPFDATSSPSSSSSDSQDDVPCEAAARHHRSNSASTSRRPPSQPARSASPARPGEATPSPPPRSPIRKRRRLSVSDRPPVPAAARFPAPTSQSYGHLPGAQSWRSPASSSLSSDGAEDHQRSPQRPGPMRRPRGYGSRPRLASAAPVTIRDLRNLMASPYPPPSMAGRGRQPLEMGLSALRSSGQRVPQPPGSPVPQGFQRHPNFQPYDQQEPPLPRGRPLHGLFADADSPSGPEAAMRRTWAPPGPPSPDWACVWSGREPPGHTGRNPSARRWGSSRRTRTPRATTPFPRQ